MCEYRSSKQEIGDSSPAPECVKETRFGVLPRGEDLLPPDSASVARERSAPKMCADATVDAADSASTVVPVDDEERRTGWKAVVAVGVKVHPEGADCLVGDENTLSDVQGLCPIGSATLVSIAAEAPSEVK